MKFNWINLFGGVIVLLILIPNIIYALKNKEETHEKSNIVIVITEQVGRYACMLLMIVPLFVGEFGFSPLEFMFNYLIGNLILLVFYYIFWVLFAKNKSLDKALALAAIPTLIFINSAVSVKHWTLLVFALLFGASHIYITYKNNK
ncbi:MAG: hypothetical protein PUE46_08190 [Eubacteriales bacterium]|nr:hypothetical protein [Eubacteriales bacterium]